MRASFRLIGVCGLALLAMTSQSPGAEPDELAAQILDAEKSDEERTALIAAHPDQAAEVIVAMTTGLEPGDEEYVRIPWIWRVAIAAGKRDVDGQILEILKVSLPEKDQPLRDWQSVVIGGGIINGISQQNVWPRERLAAILEDQDDLSRRWARLIVQSREMADNEDVPTGTRYDALRILGCGAWEDEGNQLTKYLAEGTHEELQMGAVSGLVDVDHPAAAAALAGALTHLQGTNRTLALDGLLRGNTRPKQLLDAVETGTVTSEELGSERAEQLTQHDDQTIRTRARKLLAK
jgi:hypothetical protein